MANINKSFNFRNGVQVDYDNFIVNPNGLVGIGTSIPREFLDVYGTAKITGLVTTTNLCVTGFSTFTEVRLGTGIKMSSNSGIITATAFYGNGATLTNLPTSQWQDIDVGLGFTSIYNRGYVGVATNDPRYFFQVGGNPNTQSGVGFNSTGDINATGIITSGYFSGNGASLTSLNATNITSGTIGNSYLPVLNNDRLPSSISVSGIITATTGFKGDITGNVYSSGVSTFVSGIVGNLTGTASTAQSLTGTPNITVGSINSGNINSTGIITASTIGVGFATAGIATIFSTLNVGTNGTKFVVLNSGRIGVGTALPTSEFQIINSSSTLLEVISNTSSSTISIGQSVGVGKSTAVLRFGNTPKTFDIINNDTGSINQYLHAGLPGVGTGGFYWLYGQTNNELMSLTYQGSLGIGITNPSNTLHVVGTSTVTGDANFGGNVTISGSLTPGTLNLSQFTGNVSGNINATSGVSTFNNIQTNSNIILSSSSSIGIGTTLPIVYLDARNKSALFGSVGVGTTALNSNTLSVNGSMVASKIGIGTTSTDAYLGVYGNIEIYPPSDGPISSIKLYSSEIIIDNITRIGIGTTAPRSVIDFADAGRNFLSGQGSFMLPPRLTTLQRVGLTTVEGAFIYNTDSKKFQGYTGIAWTDFN
jgi:hypothetical protein